MCVRMYHYARSRIKSITRQRGELSRRGAPRHLSSSDRAGFDFVLTLSAYRRCENLFVASRGLEKLLITLRQMRLLSESHRSFLFFAPILTLSAAWRAITHPNIP